MRARSWRLARQVVQALSLVLALALVAYTLRDTPGLMAGDFLLRLDPLAAIASMLSSRQWLGRFIPALVLIIATLGLGRFWCGWLCPLGTVVDWVSPRSTARPLLPPRWRRLKYSLLLLILFAALLGNLTLMVLDPLTIFLRSVTTLVLPALNWLVIQAEIALYPTAPLRGVLDAVDSALRGPLLSYEQPHYARIFPLAILLGGVLAMNLVARRGWCRYLCPLGGLLGLFSKASWLKRRSSPSCAYCGTCEDVCRMGAVDLSRDHAVDSGECIACMDCAANCPQQAVSFVGDWRVDWGGPYDPSRRQVLGSLAMSLGGLALLRISPSAHHPDPHRLRPPGAEEGSLLASCVRCGACLRICPTHGLQPSLSQSGLEGLWTPILVPRLGHCEYSCTSCGEICPTEAIPQLTLQLKNDTPIGKAYIDPAICIAWSGRGSCIVCEEMCPVPEKAIILEEKELGDSEGTIRTLQVPVVVHDRCIGCGLCENKCPVRGEAAIRVILDPMT